MSISKEKGQYYQEKWEEIEYRFANIEMKKEIERLNNIINEIEKYINENYVYDEVGMKIFDASKLQDKLQELKGDESNGR